MTLSGYGSRFERRRRDQWRMAMFRLLVYAVVVGAIAYWAYAMGGERAESRNRILEQQAEALEEEASRLRQETEAAVTARVQATDRAAEFQRRYEREVPQGVLHDIMTGVQARIDAGVDPQRIAFVVGAVENDVDCESEVTSRRFILQTPISAGAHSSVAFADHAITVTGVGASAHDSGGNAEAWFDPGEPVRISFARPGGEESVAEGVLPLHHAVVIGDKAHRYTISAADTRGFVLVSEQVCAYP